MKKITFFIIYFFSIMQSSEKDLKIHTDSLNPLYHKIDKKNYWNPNLNGEYLIYLKLVQDGNIIFDVGASFGTHINNIVEKKSNLIIYGFEPIPPIYDFLKVNLFRSPKLEYPELIKIWPNFENKIESKLKYKKRDDFYTKLKNNSSVYLYNIAISDFKGLSNFQYIPSKPSVSSIDKNNQNSITCQIETIDNFCKEKNINFIDFIKIDTEGNDFNVIMGANEMISRKKIKFIQFEYIKRCKLYGWNLEKAFNYFKNKEYKFFKIVSDGLVYISEWNPALETYIYGNFLATAIDI